MMSLRKYLVSVSVATLALGVPSGKAAEDTLSKIKEKGTMVVGLSATYEPWEFMDGQTIAGFDPELSHKLAAALGVKAELVDTDWTGVIPAFYAGNFDVIISAMSVSSERLSKVLFTQPYEVHTNYLVAKDKNIKSAAELEGKIIASVSTDADQEILEHWKSLGHEFKDILFLGTQQEAFLAVEAGRADAAIAAYGIARDYAEKRGYSFVEGWGPMKYTAIAVRNEDEALCKALDAEITKLKASGELAELYGKWFKMPAMEDKNPPEYKVCEQGQ